MKAPSIRWGSWQDTRGRRQKFCLFARPGHCAVLVAVVAILGYILVSRAHLYVMLLLQVSAKTGGSVPVFFRFPWEPRFMSISSLFVNTLDADTVTCLAASVTQYQHRPSCHSSTQITSSKTPMCQCMISHITMFTVLLCLFWQTTPQRALFESIYVRRLSEKVIWGLGKTIPHT